ncbi:MAG: glycosyl hydrolase, partial [Planctomycetota bacterium]
RWPLYRVYADYTSRLSLLLSGGRHVCPVAFLFLGNSRRVGKSVPPEPMTTALEDALFDCDWMPYGVFEDDAALQGKSIALHRERYQVLIVPPVEVLPYATLAKAKAFFAAGGVVVGYGFLPTKSATLGRASRDIAALTEAIWGAPKPGTTACRKSPAGGRSYFLPAKPTPEQIQEALTADAGIHPTLEVLQGKTNRWLHVLHRVKADRDVFLVCNQDHKSQAKSFRLRLTAEGTPECWDPMRNEVAAVLCERKADHVELDLTLEPSESVLLVFQAAERPLPRRLTPEAKPVADPIPIVRQPEQEPAGGPPASEEKPSDASALEGCKWIWYPEGNPAASAPPATRYFRKTISLPPGRKVRSAVFRLTCDNDFVLYVNGTRAGASDRTEENWRQLKTLDVTKHLKAGDNTLAIQAVNASDEANPAGLVGRLVIEFETGKPLKVPTEASWKTIRRAPPGWESPDFDDSKWAAAKEVARFGQTPWGRLGGRRRGMTRSPVTADPFTGRCTLPDGLDLSRVRVYLVMEDLAPEEAARVTVNGADAGGLIGKPLRLEVTAHLRTGANTIRIEPFAPETAHLAVYGR